jgi:hypothetical protein
MNIYDKIIATYPELLEGDFFHHNKGGIHLVDDGDGIAYINKWDYKKPIPEGLSVGKPEIN